MLVGIARPDEQGGERAGQVALQKRAYGKLRRAERREKPEHVERTRGIVEPVARDEFAERERDEAVPDARGEGAQRGELRRVGAGQGGVQADGGLAHAVHQLARVEAFERQGEKSCAVEAGLDLRDEVGEPAVERGIEPVFERDRGVAGHGGGALRAGRWRD